MLKILSTLVAVSLVGSASLAFADDSPAATTNGEKPEQYSDTAQRSKHARHDESSVGEARHAIGEFQRADPGLSRFFHDAAGYAVFATVGKGAIALGGAHGKGVLYENGVATGKATLTQVTFGLQLGGQAYSEVIFFESKKSLDDFKKGQFAMAAQMSAVAAASGASENANYVEGVSVFTLAKGGLMAEASVGGQRFSYHPFQEAMTTSSR